MSKLNLKVDDTKVICVTTEFRNDPNKNYAYLTKGKIYEVVKYQDDLIIIIDDDGDRGAFTNTNLKKLSDFRQDKLKILLDE